MLEMKNVHVTFSSGTPGAHVALKGLNFRAEQGEFVTIIGSNGAGKSTIFGAICGAFWPDTGSIFLDGENITYQKEHKRAHNIGRLFQDPMKGTAPQMTVAENLALSYSRSQRGGLRLALNKKDRAFFAEKLREYDMGLEQRMDTKVGLLSGGQRQALTLLMSTIVPPKLLLLDEHTAALDPASAEKILEITMKTAKKNKLTTLMITHNISSALRCGTRTVMLDEGEIVLDLSGEERSRMSVDDLVKKYKTTREKTLDSDRMLLQKSAQ